jgi:hypothetical protein
MLGLFFDATLFFVGLGFMEAVIKPLATKLFQNQISTYLSPALNFLDERLPGMIGRERGDQIENSLRSWLEIEKGVKLTQKQIDYIFSIYDARVTANKALSNEQKNSDQ